MQFSPLPPLIPLSLVDIFSSAPSIYFFLKDEKPSFTPIYNYRQNYIIKHQIKENLLLIMG
jgi:hypothetical protein